LRSIAGIGALPYGVRRLLTGRVSCIFVEALL
jgi:hypothetical protein